MDFHDSNSTGSYNYVSESNIIFDSSIKIKGKEHKDSRRSQLSEEDIDRELEEIRSFLSRPTKSISDMVATVGLRFEEIGSQADKNKYPKEKYRKLLSQWYDFLEDYGQYDEASQIYRKLQSIPKRNQLIVGIKYFFCHINYNPKLFLSRMMAGNIWKQLGMVFIPLIVLCIGVWLIWGVRPIIDMLSPVSLRNAAYNVYSVKPSSSIEPSSISLLPPENSVGGLFVLYLLGVVLFPGLMVATITNIFRTWGERFRSGEFRFYSFKNHIVILGYNRLVPGIIEKMCGDDKDLPNKIRIVVGVNGDVHGTYEQLNQTLSSRQRKCVVMLKADSNNEKDLRKKMRVTKAKEIYIIGGGTDAYRMNSYEKIRYICGEKMPECYVEMGYQSIFTLFQANTRSVGYEKFHAFNPHDIWARKLVMDEKIDTRGGESISASSEAQVHLVVLGMREMGEALAREAALLCHYPNFVTKGIRTQITFIDPHAQERMDTMVRHYSQFFDLCRYKYSDIINNKKTVPYVPKEDFLDVEFEFIQARIDDKRVKDRLSRWAKNTKRVLTIAVCVDEAQEAMTEGLCLPEEIYTKRIPVWIFQPTQGDMKKHWKPWRFSNVSTFGMSGKELDIKNESLLRQAKRMNHFYCHPDDATYNSVDVEKEWHKLPIYNKWSNLYSVSAIPVRLRSWESGKMDDEENISKVEHNRWNVEKLLMGFRPTTEQEHREVLSDYGKKSMFKQKFVHDDIRPFEKLHPKTLERNIDSKFTKAIPQIIGKE